MAFYDGFVVAVPTANKDTYRAHAEAAMALFREFGATRLVETWGDDVPRGKVNDLWGAVQAKEDETVVFSWIEYPDKATRDAAGEKMMNDPRMAEMGEMPFDGKRMIYGGFAPLVEEGGSGAMGYADGFVLPVRPEKRDAYVDMASKAATVFLDHGASRYVEAWGEDVPKGEITDFHRAAHAGEEDEVVFAWIEWPSKEARTEGWAKVMADERMATPPADTPFDGQRMIYGGFATLVDA